MKVKILGCSGSETIGHMPPGFLVNDVMMLDAGTITAALSIKAQSAITDVLISHTHLDHIKSVLFLADNIIGRTRKPVNIRAIPEVIEAIRKHHLARFYQDTDCDKPGAGLCADAGRKDGGHCRVEG